MACDVLLARAAEQDRDQVVEYLLNRLDSRAAAMHFLDQLDEVIAYVGSHPLGCPLCAEPRLAALGYRKASFPEMSYVTIYRPLGEAVVIARVFHTRQNYARLL